MGALCQFKSGTELSAGNQAVLRSSTLGSERAPLTVAAPLPALILVSDPCRHLPDLQSQPNLTSSNLASIQWLKVTPKVLKATGSRPCGPRVSAFLCLRKCKDSAIGWKGCGEGQGPFLQKRILPPLVGRKTVALT